MIVLGIDTATFVTAVGIRRNGRVVSERRETARGGHASSLPRLVEEAMHEAAIRAADLDGIGVSAGPGSFTGLRVGVSFAKGMAWVTGAALAGVSTPRALARAAGAVRGPVGICLDARRGEVYLAVYEVVTFREIQAPVAVTPARAAAVLGSLGAGTVLGDAAERYADAFAGLEAQRLDLSVSPPTGGAVAFEAEECLRRGEVASASGLVPHYVRASEAEVRRRETSLTMEKTL